MSILVGLGVAAFWLPALQAASDSEVIGEAFGKPVSNKEFAYHHKTATLFSRTGQGDRPEEKVRKEAWENLVMLEEVDRLGITVDKEKLRLELQRLVSEKGIEYGGDLYKNWVWLTFQEDVQTFEKRVEELMRINQLIQQKINPEVTVTDEEIQEKFLLQYHSFESEYIHFDTEAQAQEFLNAVKANPALWKKTFDQKKTEQGQKGAAWLNIMSLEALIDLWKIPREDAYRILKAQQGDFVAAKNIYGNCVFRLLYKRMASLNELDQKKREYYRNALTAMKQQQLPQAYFNDLLKRANYRDHMKEKKEAEAMKVQSRILLETSRGSIELRLFPEVAPKACENFIGLVKKGYYNGLLFHRVIKNFMVQGGDPTGTGAGGESTWGKPFEDEIDSGVTFNRPGLLAMANSGPNSNGSQFFITTVPTPWLNGKHTIFGEVVSGMEIVKQIEAGPTNSQNRPLEEQKILKASTL